MQGVIEPVQLTKKGKSAYKQYQILIGVSHHGEAIDKKGFKISSLLITLTLLSKRVTFIYYGVNSKL